MTEPTPQENAVARADLSPGQIHQIDQNLAGARADLSGLISLRLVHRGGGCDAAFCTDAETARLYDSYDNAELVMLLMVAVDKLAGTYEEYEERTTQ